MKDNKEFLDGIYKKAEILERERFKKTRIYRNIIKFGAVAAAIVIMPLAFNSINKDYTEIPEMVRMFTTDDPKANFYEADYIIIGNVKDIGKSQYVERDNYIYTDVTIEPEKVFLGTINKERITLRVKGGKVKKEKVFSKLEGEFKKGERSLLFLREEDGKYYLINSSISQFLEVEKNVFKDKEDNKYTIEDIKNNIKRREE